VSPAASSGAAVARELAGLLGSGAVLAGDADPRYLADATEGRGLRGRADAVALPADAGEVAAVVAWCCAHGVPVVPRGGGTGYAGGAVPDGGVVLSLERLTGVRSFDAARWRMEVEAGLTTAHVRRLARESGLWFPPDPGAAESSQIGGNVATNAGGPHAFKYGATGAWVTGIEAVVPPGELVRVGGPLRKDVAGYDLLRLLVGSEGTLGVITAAWLRLIPAPEAAYPVAAVYADVAAGCAAVGAAMASGIVPAAIEYLDAGALRAAGGSFPAALPRAAAMLVIVEADGSREEATRGRAELLEALAPAALATHAPSEPAEREALWRWRDGVSHAVTAQRGGKLSEDVVVPLDRLGEAIGAVVEIGARHRLEACSWGHAGDGNLHATFLLDPHAAAERERAAAAAEDLFALAATLGGSISGEHGVGLVKRGQLARQWSPRALELHAGVKRLFDPEGVMNPGKKVGRPAGAGDT